VALGIVLAALVALTVKASTRRPRTGARVAPSDEELVVPRREDPPHQVSPPPARRVAGPPHARVGISHLQGRVLAPPGEDLSFDELAVNADDGRRSFAAAVTPDGRFSIHLPAGRYAVTASLGAEVGIAPSVAAPPGAAGELTIQLGPAAAIRGHVRGPDGATINVRVALAGHEGSLQTVEAEAGDFTIDALIPGRRYDLTFTGDDLRATTLRSVIAPADRLAAAIDALPVLRGAIGIPPGEQCPIDRVALRALGPPAGHDDEDDDSDGGDVDETCRFQLTVPDGASQMLLVATGSGWNLEEWVSIPPLGDPEPVCLNPPCRPGAIEGKADLRISLEDDAVGGDAEVEGQGEGEIEDEVVVQ